MNVDFSTITTFILIEVSVLFLEINIGTGFIFLILDCRLQMLWRIWTIFVFPFKIRSYLCHISFYNLNFAGKTWIITTEKVRKEVFGVPLESKAHVSGKEEISNNFDVLLNCIIISIWTLFCQVIINLFIYFKVGK